MPAAMLDRQRLYAAFVGKNADYYQRRWAAIERTGNMFSFNWAAFFFAVFWLAYRKMYLYAFLYSVFLFVEGGVELYFDIPDRIGHILTLVFAIVAGGYANEVYRRRADMALAEIGGLAEDAAVVALQKRGGVSLAATLVAILIMSVIAGGLIAAGQYLEGRPATAESE